MLAAAPGCSRCGSRTKGWKSPLSTFSPRRSPCVSHSQQPMATAPSALSPTDLFAFAPDRPFDVVVVFDSGCLHSLLGGDRDAYKTQLLKWLAPGGDYVLGHWGKRHALDWRPIGPKRRSQTSIERLFAPELELVEADHTDFDAPFPFGPTVRGIGCWFHRPTSSSA